VIQYTAYHREDLERFFFYRVYLVQFRSYTRLPACFDCVIQTPRVILKYYGFCHNIALDAFCLILFSFYKMSLCFRSKSDEFNHKWSRHCFCLSSSPKLFYLLTECRKHCRSRNRSYRNVNIHNIVYHTSSHLMW